MTNDRVGQVEAATDEQIEQIREFVRACEADPRYLTATNRPDTSPLPLIARIDADAREIEKLRALLRKALPWLQAIQKLRHLSTRSVFPSTPIWRSEEIKALAARIAQATEGES